MAGKAGQGAVIARGDGQDPEVFTAVANVTNLTPPSASRETYDVTAHDSPENAAGYISMEFIASAIVDEGEVEFDIFYDPAKHEPVRVEFAKTQPTNWEITLADGTTMEFAAILMSFPTSVPFDGPMEGSMTLKVSGPVDITVAP